MPDDIRLKIAPRFVRQDEDGSRPFQRETLDAIKNSAARLIFVEAPVGSGKSYILRNLIQDEHFQGKPILLTYPTKILMDAQVESMKKEISDIAVWPDDEEKFPVVGNGINILKYSSDSLIKYIQRHPTAFDSFKNRGDLIKHGLFELSYGEHQIFVTTPDVLWLIYALQYKGAKMLQAQLKSAIVSFDEFHAYANLYNFYGLLENLIVKSKVDKILLLSATPFMRKKGWDDIKEKLKEKNISTTTISFQDSQVEENKGVIFNYPLDMNLYSFNFYDKKMTVQKIEEILSNIETPAAIIFDSIFRLKHLKPQLLKYNETNNVRFKIKEWSGMHKDKDVFNLVRSQGNVIVLGTSAIEVGVDMKFRSLITEASDWASAIQRIGRVGRMQYLPDKDISENKGHVALFFNSRDTFNRLRNETVLSRDLFESILQDTLAEPIREMVGGNLFRGESYNFILIDKYLDNPIVYSEAIFSMYDVVESQCRNFWGDDSEKAEILSDCGIRNKDLIAEFILRDKLFPIWGIVISDGLRNTYDRIPRVEKEEKPKGVTVYTQSNPAGFHFYKEKIIADYLEQRPL